MFSNNRDNISIFTMIMYNPLNDRCSIITVFYNCRFFLSFLFIVKINFNPYTRRQRSFELPVDLTVRL